GGVRVGRRRVRRNDHDLVHPEVAMSQIRLALRLYVAAVVLVALAAFVLFSPAKLPDNLGLASGLLVLATIAQLRPIHLTQKMKMTVEDSAIFAAALLLGPWLALTVAAASTLLAYARRRGAPWFEGAFNAGVSGIATFAAASLFATLGGDRSSVARYAAAAATAGVAMYLLQTALVDVAVAV